MQVDLLYTDIKKIYEKLPRQTVGIYMWMHEYCHHYLKDNPEVTKVTLTLDGEHSPHMQGKVYEFEQTKQEGAKIVKLQPKR